MHYFSLVVINDCSNSERKIFGHPLALCVLCDLCGYKFFKPQSTQRRVLLTENVNITSGGFVPALQKPDN
jgi:hypothetical protein